MNVAARFPVMRDSWATPRTGASIVTPSYDYSLYGLTVQSDMPLPLDEVVSPAVAPPDVTMIGGGPEAVAPPFDGVVMSEWRCHCPSHAGRFVMRVMRDDAQIRVWNDDAGICDIVDDGRRVVIYTSGNDDTRHPMLGHLLTGIVSILLLYQRRQIVTLHASGVVIDDRAAIFLGRKGQGKSTMAAGFLRRGAALLTDDLLPLLRTEDGIDGVPGTATMKLWDESVEHALGYAGEASPIGPDLPKKLIELHGQYDIASSPVRLKRIYLLDRYEPANVDDATIAIVPVRPANALVSVIAQTPLRNYLPKQMFAELLPVLTQLVNQVSVNVIRFPSGYALQDAVLDHIEADLRRAP